MIKCLGPLTPSPSVPTLTCLPGGTVTEPPPGAYGCLGSYLTMWIDEMSALLLDEDVLSRHKSLPVSQDDQYVAYTSESEL
jgi:hypothetical protein